MSKKELKFPSMIDSILMRASLVLKSKPSGISTVSDPSLGVLSARTSVNSSPLFGEIEILTLAQLIGADVVPPVAQTTVCRVPCVQVPVAEFGVVTPKGPAPPPPWTCTVALAIAPELSRAVPMKVKVRVVRVRDSPVKQFRGLPMASLPQSVGD